MKSPNLGALISESKALNSNLTPCLISVEKPPQPLPVSTNRCRHHRFLTHADAAQTQSKWQGHYIGLHLATAVAAAAAVHHGSVTDDHRDSFHEQQGCHRHCSIVVSLTEHHRASPLSPLREK